MSIILPITQLSVAPLLGEAIQQTHTDSSISSLFEVKGFNKPQVLL